MLLDTCIVIDVLRNNADAIDFVTSLATKPALSVITATEVIGGCRNVRERRQIDMLLSSYTVLDIDLDVASRAGEYVNQYGKSHSTEPMDAIIAATAAHHGLKLATHNLKHFPMFSGLKRPY
jgi:predicted nucleic acid-binding protein